MGLVLFILIFPIHCIISAKVGEWGGTSLIAERNNTLSSPLMINGIINAQPKLKHEVEIYTNAK